MNPLIKDEWEPTPHPLFLLLRLLTLLVLIYPVGYFGLTCIGLVFAFHEPELSLLGLGGLLGILGSILSSFHRYGRATLVLLIGGLAAYGFVYYVYGGWLFDGYLSIWGAVPILCGIYHCYVNLLALALNPSER